MDGQPLALTPPQCNSTIRPVQRDDVTALCLLWPHRSELDVLWLVKRAQQQARQERGLGVIITDEKSGAVVGYGQVTLWHQAAEIADLSIIESHRSQGLGTALVQHLVQVAIQMVAKRIEIGAALNNTRALALYHRLGFQNHRTVVIDLGHGVEPVVYLSLDLQWWAKQSVTNQPGQ